MMSSTEPQQQSLLQRFANALVYIIAFPFIAIFIALKRVIVQPRNPPHSYRDRLPVMRVIAPSAEDGLGDGNGDGGRRSRSVGRERKMR
jgi:hypothetical protein